MEGESEVKSEELESTVTPPNIPARIPRKPIQYDPLFAFQFDPIVDFLASQVQSASVTNASFRVLFSDESATETGVFNYFSHLLRVYHLNEGFKATIKTSLYLFYTMLPSVSVCALKMLLGTLIARKLSVCYDKLSQKGLLPFPWRKKSTNPLLDCMYKAIDHFFQGNG